MSPPSLWQHFRQTIGRALRETGQSIHRVALKTEMLARTKHEFYDEPVLFEDHLSRHRQLFPLLVSGQPKLHENVSFIAPCATLVGSVKVGENSSIWYGAVIRGDFGENVESYRTDDTRPPWELDQYRYRDRGTHLGGAVFIGDNTNVQDSCVITSRAAHTQIGNGVTIGHLAQLHSCQVEDFCLIGMGSVLNEGVKVEKESFIGAGTVVPANTTIPSGELWLGNPARRIRALTDGEREKLHYQSSEYVQVAKGHKHIMELGGNVDTNGSSVYVLSEVDTELLPSGDQESVQESALQVQGEVLSWQQRRAPGVENLPRRLQRDNRLENHV